MPNRMTKAQGKNTEVPDAIRAIADIEEAERLDYYSITPPPRFNGDDLPRDLRQLLDWRASVQKKPRKAAREYSSSDRQAEVRRVVDATMKAFEEMYDHGSHYCFRDDPKLRNATLGSFLKHHGYRDDFVASALTYGEREMGEIRELLSLRPDCGCGEDMRRAVDGFCAMAKFAHDCCRQRPPWPEALTDTLLVMYFG